MLGAHSKIKYIVTYYGTYVGLSFLIVVSWIFEFKLISMFVNQSIKHTETSFAKISWFEGSNIVRARLKHSNYKDFEEIKETVDIIRSINPGVLCHI